MEEKEGVIFIGDDFILKDLFDELEQEFSHRGHKVIRGWGAEPPQHTEYSREEYARYFSETDVIIISTRTKCPSELLDAAPALRAVIFPTIGTESIDLTAANNRGIIVGHGATPENFESMAEATVMLFIVLMQDLHLKESLLRQNLQRPSPKELKARMVKGKTIGLIGYGRIARAVAKRMQGWDAQILAHDPYVDKNSTSEAVDFVSIETLLKTSDIVSVHVSLDDKSSPVLGPTEIRMMKRGSFLVNTARGRAIDEAAVYRALDEKQLAGAALDAFQNEPLPNNSPLRGLERVILTNHIVGHTQEIFESLSKAAIENVSRVLSGEPPLYVRNPSIIPTWKKRLRIE